ncbi:hypothetical protein F0L17_08725 [Streptomyces sp. TRM43335]|uniref:Uncharacterized protein n=1 Tax=Streptomyces taklimakanensis TaxID=2569853 RepID=A0A6G2BAC2_9ACTN|nr:hypothetical protein [Streptomyces taklimakanensis]MTE19208.1 hypothetical protein [Streptomyces taklimakanensis]
MRAGRALTFRLHLAAARGDLRGYVTYRVATFPGILTDTVFGFFLSDAFVARWDERPNPGGHGQAQALTFVWTGRALPAAMAMAGGGFEGELRARTRSGDVVADPYRPADLRAWWPPTAPPCGGRAGSARAGRRWCGR